MINHMIVIVPHNWNGTSQFPASPGKFYRCHPRGWLPNQQLKELNGLDVQKYSTTTENKEAVFKGVHGACPTGIPLGSVQKAQVTNTKISKWDYIKTKNLLHNKRNN